MWLSIRRIFRHGDDGWDEYVGFIGLPALTEVRSLDSALNATIHDCGWPLASFREVEETLRSFPPLANDREFSLLVLDAERETLPAAAEARLLGHDLSDETRTSSLLNCGPWTGELAEFTPRLNRYGLLSYEDAISAKARLPSVWRDDPHAQVTVWALYECSVRTA